jgi:hypothetical protein
VTQPLLRFSALGATGIRFWLYRYCGSSRYNWATYSFDNRNEQSTIIPADADGMITLDLSDRLDDGNYELHVVPSSVRSEPNKCRKIFFRLGTNDDGSRWCEKTGEVFDLEGSNQAAPVTAQPPSQPKLTTGTQTAQRKVRGPTLEYKGELRALPDLAAELGIDPRVIYARMAQGYTVDEALATPPEIAPQRIDVRSGRMIELE